MRIALGTDHAGYEYKESIKAMRSLARGAARCQESQEDGRGGEPTDWMDRMDQMDELGLSHFLYPLTTT